MDVPDFLTHYYDCERGPFRSLSDLPADEAAALLATIHASGEGFAARRDADYLAIRRDVETRVRALFVAKGGKPRRTWPHSMLLGECDWVRGWYVSGCALQVPLDRFKPGDISFTYGDIFPAMRYADGKPYRGQVYTLDELPELIATWGLPQVVNPDGALGPDRYIEAQVWNDVPLQGVPRP